MTAQELNAPGFVTSVLSQPLFDCGVLVSYCPLDYGNHEFQPTVDLGAIDKLPMELKHQVLKDIDVESLLVFRRVNKEARAVVDGMLEWQKVRPLAYIVPRNNVVLAQGAC